MEQEYSDTNDVAPSCSTGQGFGGGLRDSYSSARGGSSFESRGGGFRGRDWPRHDRGGRGDFGSPGRSGDRPMGGSYGVDRRGPPQRHSSMDRSYSDRAQPAMRRVAPVEVQPKSISLNRKKGEPDASKPKVAPMPPRPNDKEYTSSVAGEKPEVVEKDKGDVLRDSDDGVNASKFSPKVEPIIEEHRVYANFKEKAQDDEEKDKIIAKLKGKVEDLEGQLESLKSQLSRKEKAKASNDGGQGVSVQENTGTSPSNEDRLFEFNIPSVMCGLFIGKGGWRIEMIRQQSGAKIHLQNNPSTPQFKTCVMEGSQRSLDTAWRIIKKEIPAIHLPGMDGPPDVNPVIRPKFIPKRLEETFREIELKQDKLAAIMFVDLDNFNFFEKLPKDIHLPENLYVVGFNGGDQTWRPSESEAYHQHKQKGIFSLVLSGTEKDAADKDLKELAGMTDSTISPGITFFILSGDGGFFNFLKTAKRYVDIQNPHKTLVRQNLYDVILNHMKP